MNRRRIALALAVAAAGLAAVLWLRRGGGELHYTGFVEGEERVLRSEVSGRVVEVALREGDAVPADAVVARIDDAEISSRIATKRQELSVLEAQIARQQEQVELSDATWQRDVSGREAALRQAQAEATLAERTYERQQRLRENGVSSPQQLDEARSKRDATHSAVDAATEALARAQAMQGEIALAKQQLEVLRRQLDPARAQLAELEVLHAKYFVHAPGVPTVVQTQLLWPGELAQPGTPILSVLDPRDKYVQIYVPVSDAARVRVGQRVEIELDSQPGKRVPGEVSFVADSANFTPEKIETRSDRMGQVYRAKVRILEDVERFAPGTEGNVYLVSGREEPQRTASKER